jgi:hypothetical protein
VLTFSKESKIVKNSSYILPSNVILTFLIGVFAKYLCGSHSIMPVVDILTTLFYLDANIKDEEINLSKRALGIEYEEGVFEIQILLL